MAEGAIPLLILHACTSSQGKPSQAPCKALSLLRLLESFCTTRLGNGSSSADDLRLMRLIPTNPVHALLASIQSA
jgi:hypothetical protein